MLVIVGVKDPHLSVKMVVLNEMIVKANYISRLRKVKMDQRKLMDNANTITDMAKVNI